MTENISKIDALIAAARQRKAAREAAGEDAPATEKKQRAPKAAKEPKEPKVKKEKVVDEEARAGKEAERAQRKAQIEQDRAERKAAREQELQAKRAERDAAKAGKKTAHMSKVERAEAKLPRLHPTTIQEYNDIIVNFSAEQIAGLALWLQHYNRVKATERALDAKLNIGDQVEIIGGDPKWVGKTGTVSEVRRIRCFVEIPGVTKPVYLFTSDVSPAAQDTLSTGTEG